MHLVKTKSGNITEEFGFCCLLWTCEAGKMRSDLRQRGGGGGPQLWLFISGDQVCDPDHWCQVRWWPLSSRCGDTSQDADSYHEPHSFHMHQQYQQSSQYLLLAPDSPDTQTEFSHISILRRMEFLTGTHTRRTVVLIIILWLLNYLREMLQYPPLSCVSGCVSGECRLCCMLALSFPPPGDKTVTTRHPARSRYTIYNIYSAPHSADCDWFPLKLNRIDCLTLTVGAVGCDLHQTRVHCLIITPVSCGLHSWRVTDRRKHR